MDFLIVRAISKQERDFTLNEISFTQQRFQKIAVAGATGSGKSTLLKIIGGLAQPDAGDVFFEDKKVRGPEEKLIPGHPGIAYLSQHFELRNNYYVEEELNYTNRLSDEEAAAIFDICDISHLLKRKTNQLSGGERQRIVMARLLISSPRLLLLDEPFSNLDAIHKNIMKTVIHDVGEKLGITCILISHDPVDVLSWADEIIILKDGKLIQKGAPEQVYRQPVDTYVAGLFGNYNLLDAQLVKTIFNLPKDNRGGKALFIRPESFQIEIEESRGIKGIVNKVSFFGSYYELEVQLAATSVIVKTANSQYATRDAIFLTLKADGVWYI